MRLHGLTVTAFGPFAGTEHIDFDELNEAGLFLLTGPTGAGKSSLLDAVCFALYGTVPGVRGVKVLKSQHAPAAARPEVVLDLTVQSRRFTLRRSPEWTRPKQRGTGLLTEKASASLMETTGGRAHLLSSRAAEVGLMVGDLMGMNAGQFVQVALLPQGEFQRFLRASSQERHDVLQQLFRTDRFARIEDWVGDHSRRLREQAGAGAASVRRILDTAAERAGVMTPEELCGDELAVAAAGGRVLAWVGDLLAVAESEARAARDGLRDRAERLRTARQLHQHAVRRREQLARRESALAALAALETAGPDVARARRLVAGHERGVRCRPVLEVYRQAQAMHLRATAERDLAVRALTTSPAGTAPPAPGDVSSADVQTLADEARTRLARLEALLPREQAANVARRDRDRDALLLQAAEGDLAEATLRARQVPVEIERISAELTPLTALAARREVLSSSLERAHARLRAAAQLVEARLELTRLEDARRDARDRMQDAREDLQGLVERRREGMAAELAEALTEGAPCQVCGSTEHPAKAAAATDAVTDQDHRAADRRVAEATEGLDRAEQDLRRAHRAHDVLVAASGQLTLEQGSRDIAELEAELVVALDAGQRRDDLTGRLADLRTEQAALGRRETSAASRAAGLRESVSAHDRLLAVLTAEIAAELGEGQRRSSITAATARQSAWCDLLGRAQQALAELDAAAASLDAADRQVRAAATEQGFSTLAEVEEAVLTDRVLDQLSDQLREHADARARARAILDDPDLVGPEVGPDVGPDVGPGRGAAVGPRRGAVLGAPADACTRAAELEEAESAEAAAARRLALLEDRVASLRLLSDRLSTAMDAWAPVRDESLRAEAISRLVRGMGEDNQLQMRLSAYVLATRLDQVVDAANERLGHMRDQRYLLRRTGRAERRSARAGLGLEIVDQWTGDVRSPSTLSGGETFVVSLSLALGLADVVTHESGGTEVDTLFVDEGFGLLDADTLDDVMDRLDGLRAGGRTVGVVSHVTELRSRIPTQVQVDKGRAGSTVEVRTLVG
jgi:exonuclease SbcC